MKALADTIGEFIGGLLPEPPRGAGVNLDEVAEEGRLALWCQEHRKLDDAFHPSSLKDPCMRFDVVRLMVVHKEWDYAAHGIDLAVKPDTDPDPALFDYILHRRFDVGTALHEMEQNKYFGKTTRLLGRWKCRNCNQILHRPQIRPQKKCTNMVWIHRGDEEIKRPCREYCSWEYLEVRMQHEGLGISSRIDLPILHQGRVYIGDLKTLGAGRWEQLQRYGRCFPKDETQLKIYLFLANNGEYFRYPVEEGILRYIHQGDPEAGSVHFGVARDPNVESWLHEYIGSVRQLAKEGRWKVATCWCDKKTQARAKRCPLRPLCFQ